MGIRSVAAISAVLLAGCAGVAKAPPADKGPSGPLARFAALAGCWQSHNGNRVSTEFWLAPTRNEMLGLAQSVRDGRTTGYEYMRLAASDSGEVTFTAMPSGQPQASFRLVSINASEAVFENPQHDFPQRIGYRFPADDTLAAYIEGESDGQRQRIDFVKSRVSCR